jgi:hypothetical protein
VASAERFPTANQRDKQGTGRRDPGNEKGTRFGEFSSSENEQSWHPGERSANQGKTKIQRWENTALGQCLRGTRSELIKIPTGADAAEDPTPNEKHETRQRIQRQTRNMKIDNAARNSKYKIPSGSFGYRNEDRLQI